MTPSLGVRGGAGMGCLTMETMGGELRAAFALGGRPIRTIRIASLSFGAHFGSKGNYI